MFIDAKNRHYGFDIVPAFLDWLSQAHHDGRVFTVERCAQEVLAGGDELSEWMRAQASTFAIKLTADDQAALQIVSRWATSAGYRQRASAEFLSAGDYFLVAQALSRGYTVVTQEAPAPLSQKKMKIPTPATPWAFSDVAVPHAAGRGCSLQPVNRRFAATTRPGLCWSPTLTPERVRRSSRAVATTLATSRLPLRAAPTARRSSARAAHPWW